MLNIVVNESASGVTTVHLEGQVVGRWVGELERACEPILARGNALRLDLTSVSFLGGEGVHLLWKQRDRQVSLLHCTGFEAEQLKSREGTPA